MTLPNSWGENLNLEVFWENHQAIEEALGTKINGVHFLPEQQEGKKVEEVLTLTLQTIKTVEEVEAVLEQLNLPLQYHQVRVVQGEEIILPSFIKSAERQKKFYEQFYSLKEALEKQLDYTFPRFQFVTENSGNLYIDCNENIDLTKEMIWEEIRRYQLLDHWIENIFITRTDTYRNVTQKPPTKPKT